MRLNHRAVGLHAKLMLALALVVVLLASASTYVLVERERERRLTELEGRATRIAELYSRSLAQPLSNLDRAAIGNQLAALAPNPEVLSFRVTAPGQGIVAEVGRRQAATSPGTTVRVRPIEFAPRPGVQTTRIGEIEVVLTRAVVEQAIADAQRTIVALVAGTVALLYLTTYVVLRRIVGTPVRRLQETLDRIAQGDLDADCPVQSGDELGRLALHVNAMGGRLRESLVRLRESEARYREIFENALEGIFQMDREGRIRHCNPALARLLGYASPAELMQASSIDCASPVPCRTGPFTRDQREMLFAALDDDGKIGGVELELVRSDGRPIWVQITARLRKREGDASGSQADVAAPEATELEGLVTDITSRKQALEDLREHRDRLEQAVLERTSELRQQARYLRTLIDMLPMWAWFKDTDSRYLAVNRATADACGLTIDGMVGKRDHELWPPELARAYREDDLRVMASHERRSQEEPWAASGATVWLETYKAPVIDEDGSVLGTVGVARDISDRKASESAREAALAEAERLARQRSQFLAQMSHELRTPLNGILGFAELLLRDEALGERQSRRLRVIEESGRHLLTLIDDILDLARVDAGKLELSPDRTNLPAFLQVVTDIVRVKAEEKGLAFDYRPDPDMPTTVWVDEKRLRQVLLNLLSNAVKFTDAGHVGLRVQSVPTSAGPGPSGAEGRAIARLRFEVHDSGIGMDETQQARLFQPFEQVAAVERRVNGAGLGLAISRELIRVMGSDIRVRSSPGHGSTFAFELDLPAAHAPAGTSPPRRDGPTGYAGRRRKVLVVDDVEPNRAVLDDLLTALGFDVVDAADGRQALSVAARERPDIVIMDITMPVMDGLESTRRMRLDPELAHIPVIATSAGAAGDVEQRSNAAGTHAFISKPISHEALLRIMGELMDLTWVHDESAPGQPRGDDAAADSLVPPPPDEMDVLRQLARVGNMRAIRERAQHVKELDPRYVPFADRLFALAEGCQSMAITTLVERCSVEDGTS